MLEQVHLIHVPDHEWQMLQAFIGYPDRHLGEQIDSISIHYR